MLKFITGKIFHKETLNRPLTFGSLILTWWRRDFPEVGEIFKQISSGKKPYRTRNKEDEILYLLSTVNVSLEILCITAHWRESIMVERLWAPTYHEYNLMNSDGIAGKTTQNVAVITNNHTLLDKKGTQSISHLNVTFKNEVRETVRSITTCLSNHRKIS